MMKLQIMGLVILAWMTCLQANSQQLSKGEYFFNTYVDFDRGTAFTLSQSQQEVSLNVDVSELPEGFNVMFFRAKNNGGLWSMTNKSVFYKYKANPNPGIVEVEYYIDEYKPYGAGTKIAFEPGKDEYLIDLEGLSPGLHLFSLRAKNNLGIWSHVKKSVFYVEDGELAKIVAISYRFLGEDFASDEYLFDDFEPSTEVILDQDKFLANAEGLEVGKNYSINITAINENGLESMVYTANFRFSKGTPITIEEIKTTNLSCFGAGDGKITVIASGGDESDLEYSLDGNSFSSNNVFENLPAGDHKAYVRSKSDTSNLAEKTFAITSPAQLSVSFQNLVQPGCSGTETGSFRAVASGGSGSYTYRIGNQGSFQSGNTFNNLGEGTYRVTVRDASGCEAVAEVNLIASGQMPPVPIVTIQNSGANSSEVVLVSSASSGNRWLRNGTQISGATGRTLRIIQPGSYQVVVTNNAGCQSTSVAFEVTSAMLQPPVTIEKVETTNLTCFGANDGKATVTAEGEGTLQYSLDGMAFSANRTFENLPAGNHKVYVRSSTNTAYVVEESFSITAPARLSLTIQNIVRPGCPGEETGGFRAAASGGTGAYTYRIGSQGSFQSGNVFNNLGAGTYSVTVRDANGCEASAEVTLSASGSLPAKPTVTIEGTDGVSPEVSLVSSSTSGNQWLKDGTVIPGATGQSLQITEAGTYQVVVTSGGGCQSVSDVVAITSSSREVSSLNLRLYPNPAEHATHLGFGREAHIDRIAIYSSTGVLLREIAERLVASDIRIDLDGLAAGTYMVQVEGIGIFERLRLIKK